MKSGRETDGAVRIWAVQSSRVDWLVGLGGALGVLAARALGRKVMRISVPVSTRSWGIWRRRETLSLLMISFGFGAVVAGVTGPLRSLIVLGALMIVWGIATRARAFWNFWCSAQLRPNGGQSKQGDIVIRRSHPRFDDAARDLYLRALGLKGP